MEFGRNTYRSVAAISAASALAVSGAMAVTAEAHPNYWKTNQLNVGEWPTKEMASDAEMCALNALGSKNPADNVGSGYKAIGKPEIAQPGERANLKYFAAHVVENAVSPECRQFVTGRIISVRQIYRGKVNTKRHISFESLDSIDSTATAPLRHKFAPKGSRGRGYGEQVIAAIRLSNGVAMWRSGHKLVRAKSNGH